MDKKRTIVIIYNVSDNWVGGKYYIDCILTVLKKYENLFTIEIIQKNPGKKDIKIPGINLKFPFLYRILNKLKSQNLIKLYNKIIWPYYLQDLNKFDVIFPLYNVSYFKTEFITDSKKIYWIPDFQENSYPEYFKKTEIIDRVLMQANAAYSNASLILSSKSAFNDFSRIYPHYSCNVKIIPFITPLCFEQEIFNSFDSVNSRYNITGNYFICSNQFWVHKNHFLIIEAASLLKKQNINIKIYFTGKENDYRCHDYTNQLKQKVKELNLEENIIFLGFIPRKDQITLMKNSIAIIQPSLFEGWNTAIEEAKYLGKQVIASDIPVHKEQLADNGSYFNPHDANKLAEYLEYFINKPILTIDYSYAKYIKSYEQKILELFS
jgi:glycosyltransferase involved in cell wall biosynthesis